MNAVIYARFSCDRQREESIEGQLRACNEYAKSHGYSVIGNYIDRAISGTSDNRPQFQQMITDSSKKQFDFIIVWKLDRFARNRYDSAIYKNKLKKNGVKVLSATEGIGEGDESIILEAVLEAMAETYSKQLSQNVQRGMKENALKCKSTGGTIPLGYQLDEHGKLIINEHEAQIVKYVFEQYSQGKPKAKIVQEINNKGFRNKRGNLYTINSFSSNFFQNEKYIGTYHYNGIVIENGCPTIIDKEIFEKCKIRATANKRLSGHNKAKVEYLLTGKLFCGYCGSPMSADTGYNKKHIPYHYYVCSKKKNKREHCDKKRERKDFLEWFITEQTVNYVLIPKRIKHIAKRIVEEYRKDFSQTEIKELEKHLTHLNNEFEKVTNSLINAKSKRLIDNINKKADELELQITDTEQQLATLKTLSDVQITEDEVIQWLQQFCNGDIMDAEFRKQIIDVLVNSIYLFDDKVVIYFNVKGGKQVSYIEMLDDTEEFFNLSECSDINCCSPPINLKSEHIIIFNKNIFGAIIHREH